MPRRNTPTAMYRHLLGDAWRVTWRRKSLWVFGIFAALMSTGGVLDVAFRSFKRIEQGRDFFESVLSGSVYGFDLASQYLSQLSLLSPLRVQVTLTILTVLGVFLVLAAVLSQGALVAGLGSREEHHWRASLREAFPRLWQILFLDAVTKTAQVLLVLITTLPLVLVIARPTLFDAILYFILFLLFFPLTVVVSIISTLALIHIVRGKSNVFTAIQVGMTLFARHWLVTLELGFILFFLVLLGGIATAAVLVLLFIPYTILIIASLLSAVPLLFLLVNTIGFIVLTAVFLAYAGASVTFQHAAWLWFYERASKKLTRHTVIAKLERLWAKR